MEAWTKPKSADPYRLLVIEDNPADADLVEELLTADRVDWFEIIKIQRLEESVEHLADADVVLLDLGLPDSQGLDTLRQLRNVGPDLPVVVLTGQHEMGLGMAAMANGAQDFLMKGRIDSESLARSLRYAVKRHESQHELANLNRQLLKANEELQRLVGRDALTDVLNRHGLQDTLSRQTRRAEREGHALHAMLVGLDEFKEVNGRLGYAVGDIVLRETAHKLERTLRPTDVVARLGGDEFVVLLPASRHAEATMIAERVRLTLKESPVRVGDDDVAITASVGLVEVTGKSPSVDELLPTLHRALVSSKGAGGNRVAVYAGGRETELLPRDAAALLIKALDEGDAIRMARQGIMNLADETEAGYELLCRSSVPGCESPADLFRVSFEADILTRVDRQCFRAAMACSVAEEAGRCCVNLFPSTLINVPVEDLLAEMPEGREKGDFCVEISEQQIIGDPSYLERSIGALRTAGVGIAMDDVGFGRSNLESLIVLEPDVIKIDRQYINGVADNTGKRRALQRLLHVVRSLDSSAVAEGIERRVDLDLLRDLGVELGQGYLWGKPQ